MAVFKNYYQYLYACPVVELTGYTARFEVPGRIFAYLDFAGPTGSAKDGLWKACWRWPPSGAI